MLMLAFAVLLPACRSKKKARKAKQVHAKVRKKGGAKTPEAAADLPHGKPGDVIKAARSYLGTPYKSAGDSRLGMDCSGLVITSFAAANISLPRNSALQAETGSQVDKSRLKPGDLLFFSDSKIGRGITHVGIVTEVKSDDIRFIHASGKLGVVEVSFNVSYFQKTFTKAVRPDW